MVSEGGAQTPVTSSEGEPPQRPRKPAVLRTPTSRFVARRGSYEGPLEPSLVPRLSARFHEAPYDPEALVRVVSDSHHSLFLDTSAFDFEMPHEVWPRIIESRQLVLVGGVLRELEPWLARNKSHPAAQAVLARDPHIDFYARSALPATMWVGATFYVNLLVRRKQLLSVVQFDLARRLERPATEQEVQREVQRTYGERGWLLARKERAGFKEISHVDEELVCLAVANALYTRTPTVIVTRDKDVFEQFYKLWNLIDLDYRSVLLANSYATAFSGYRPRPLVLDEPWLRDVFVDDSNNVAFERADDLDELVLPREFDFVPISCWRIGSKGI